MGWVYGEGIGTWKPGGHNKNTISESSQGQKGLQKNFGKELLRKILCTEIVEVY